MVYITSCSVNVQDLCSNYSACTSTTVFLKFAIIGRRLEYKLYKIQNMYILEEEEK